jgi:magnesium chelatase family protein
VEEARRVQARRYSGDGWRLNAELPPEGVDRCCALESGVRSRFEKEARTLSLSGRACHGALKVARTAADLAGSDSIGSAHIEEALFFRRFGDEDFFWKIP